MENNFHEKDEYLRHPPPQKSLNTSNFYSVSGMIPLLSPFINYTKKPKDSSQLSEINISVVLIFPSSQKPYSQI